MDTTKGENTRAKVLTASMNLINRNGFNGTSINDIIEATGVKKGNLYFHFRSKEELGLALLRRAKEEYLSYLAKNIKGKRPLEKIDSILKAIYQMHKKKNFIGGCIFGNTALEMGDTNKHYASLISEVFVEWITLLSTLLNEAQEEGQCAISLPPMKLARHIVATMEGGIMMARLSKKGDDFLDCIESIRALLGITTKIR